MSAIIAEFQHLVTPQEGCPGWCLVDHHELPLETAHVSREVEFGTTGGLWFRQEADGSVRISLILGGNYYTLEPAEAFDLLSLLGRPDAKRVLSKGVLELERHRLSLI